MLLSFPKSGDLHKLWGGESWLAGRFLGGLGRLKAGCGQNCPPYDFMQIALFAKN
jgi:hypothetical protein